MKNFRLRVANWLEPLVYTIIFSINHPTSTNDNVHYIKDKIRVECYLTNSEIYCVLHYDILDAPIPSALISCKLGIETVMLDVAVENFKTLISRHTK
jgi:hypothetical protein